MVQLVSKTVIDEAMKKYRRSPIEESLEKAGSVDWNNLDFESEGSIAEGLDFETESDAPMAFDFEGDSPIVSPEVSSPETNVYEGLIKPTAKALVKVPASVASSMALLPGAGIASLIELAPKISTDPNRIVEMGSLDDAMKTYKQIMSVPSKLITTPEEAKAVENISLAMKPIEMAGEGWSLIGEQVNNGLRALGLPADTYLEPLLATYGEASAIFAAPEVVKKIGNSTFYRSLTIKERSLVVQSLAETMQRNPQMTEGQLLRTYDNPMWRAEALAKRSIVEDYSKVKQFAEQKTAEATVENVLETKKSGTKKSEASMRPTEVDPDYTFTSQKGNYYEKIGDIWYDSRGKEVTNKFVVDAAESRKTQYGIDTEAVEDARIKDIEEKYGRKIDDISDKEVEDYFIEKETEPVKPTREVVKPTINFRQTDPEVTSRNMENIPSYERIDNVDSLTARIEAELNSWLDGKDIDVSPTKRLVEQLADHSKLWAEGSESPTGMFEDMTLTELENFAEYMKELDSWMRSSKRDGGTKLYDIGGAVGEGVKALFNKLTGRDSTKISEQPPEPFKTVKEEAREVVFRRGAGLGVSTYDTNKFVNSIEQRTTQAQREVMPFVIEKTDIPNGLGRADLQKVLKKDRAYLEPIAEEIKKHFDGGFKRVKAHLKDLTVKQIEDYVTHLWDIPRHKKAEAISWFSTQDRFMERRFIPTYKEGIEKGFIPKFLDVSEIIKIHDNVGNRAVENTKYIEALLNMEKDGIKLIHRGEDAPLDWIEVDYPALTRRIPLSKTQIKRKGEFVKESKVKVHPDLVRPLKVIFEDRFDHPVISAYEALNGVMKKSMLSLSLFHHGALGETGTALIGPIKTAKIMFNPVSIYKALVRGEYDVFKKEEIARDSIEHGVQYGATADIPVGRIQSYLDELARVTQDVPIASKITKFMAGFNSVWDKALWNYLHDTLKLYAYESLVGKLDPKLTTDLTKKSKREIAQVVNDTFGGQNWDTLMMTPKEVQMLTWSLLSSDWTLSTTRQALAPTGIGKVYNETKGLRKALGWKFWARAALYFGVGVNLLNVLFRSKDMKDNPQYYEDKEYSFLDKTMFGNTVGKKTYLFRGRYSDGSERYIRWGKQFRDFFELLSTPFKKIGGKIAPVPQLISEMFTGHTFSGFENDDIYGMKGLEKATGTVKTVGKAFLPISIRRFLQENIETRPLDIAMQSSKGLSRYSAMEYFKKAIVSGDEDLLRDVYVGALRNNLPAYTLFGSALSWTESELVDELAKDVKDIDDAEARLGAAISAYDKKRYGSILAKLQKDKADKESGIELLQTAIERMKQYQELELGEVPKLPSKKSKSRYDSEEYMFEEM